MSLSSWPLAERPREKLLERGPQALSDTELLAILLRVGTGGMNAVELARHCLLSSGGLAELVDLNFENFSQIKGVGMSAYTLMQAAMELSRRYCQQELKQGCFFKATETAKQYFRTYFRQIEREHFVVAFLDTRHSLLHCETMFTGSLSQAAVYPREVVRAALSHNAAALVLAHNHPSGCLDVSKSDIDLTQCLQKTCELFEIRILDHIIVGHGCVSMAELGYL